MNRYCKDMSGFTRLFRLTFKKKAIFASLGWFLIINLTVLASISIAEKPTDMLLRSTDIVRGNPNAPVTLLEYSDFTCGFCKKFFLETWPKLLARYVESGHVRFVYRDFPRSPNGPALKAAQAARCAGDQQAYWKMHDRLFGSELRFDRTTLQDHARALGLDLQQFAACLDSDKHIVAIYRDRLEGGNLGIRGTPAFLLFLTSDPGASSIVHIPGALPFDVFQQEIDKLLSVASQASAHPDEGT